MSVANICTLKIIMHTFSSFLDTLRTYNLLIRQQTRQKYYLVPIFPNRFVRLSNGDLCLTHVLHLEPIAKLTIPAEMDKW
jgi:hypothetical protein